MNETKRALYIAGREASIHFLTLNKLSLPKYIGVGIDQGKPRYTDCTGYYEKNTIVVNVASTALPVENPTYRRWSYPGYKADRTAIGVVAHETGHHVSHICGRGLHKSWKLIVQKSSKRVSSYEPNVEEAFAETMKLFILNPDLLLMGLPYRYAFLSVILGLKPIETRSYMEVVSGAGHTAAMNNWILH